MRRLRPWLPYAVLAVLTVLNSRGLLLGPVQALVIPALALDRLGVLAHQAPRLQAVALLSATAMLAAFAWARRRPAAGGLVAALAVPPLLGLGLLALGLAPASLWALALALGLARHRTPAPEPSRWLGLAIAAAVGIGLVAANGLTLLTSGPGDAQTPLDLLAALDGSPLRLLPWIGAGIVVLLPSRERRLAAWAGLLAWTTASLGDLPAQHQDGGLLAGTVLRSILDNLDALPGGAIVASIGLMGRGQSLASPASVLAALLIPLLALLHVGAVEFLGCDAVRADPRVQVLSPLPGAFAVQPVSGAVFASFRDRGFIQRLGLDGSVVVIDPRDLDLPVWAAQRRARLRAPTAYPEELGRDPQGRVYAFAELPGDRPAMALMVLNGTTGEVLDGREDDSGCFVSSWLWVGDHGLAGCEWTGRMLRFSPEGGWSEPVDAGDGEMEELALDPQDGTVLTVGLWRTPWLRRLDPDSGAVLDRTRVGTFSWGLTLDDARRPWVAGFHSRRLRRFTPSLEPDASASVGYAVRALSWAPRQRAVLAASGYDGHLYAVGPDLRTARLRLGGWLRDVDVERDGEHAVVAGLCGVLRVDLDAWLGGIPARPTPRPALP